MAPRLFYTTLSPPSRMVQLVARKIGLQLDLQLVNTGDLCICDFLAFSPQHCLPTMDDNGLVLWESRAIATYLIGLYGSTDKLYPKCPRQRALVDNMLQFDLGTFNTRISDYYSDIFLKEKPLSPSKKYLVIEAIEIFEKILRIRKWAAGNTFTVADISICISFSQLEAFEFDFSEYKKTNLWYNAAQRKLASHGYEDVNRPAMEEWRTILKSKMDQLNDV